MPDRKTDRKGIWVDIKLDGGDLANPLEFDLRWTLQDEIESRGIGDMHGGGSGGGWMDFSFGVKEASTVEATVKETQELLKEFGVLERSKIEVFDIYEQVCEDTPDFQPGDCLTFQFEDGDYGAALVLVRWNEELKSDEALVGTLDYKQATPPQLNVFDRRNWFIATADWRVGKPYLVWLHCYGGLEFTRVGKIPLTASDPKECRFHLSWEDLGEYILKDMRRNPPQQS